MEEDNEMESDGVDDDVYNSQYKKNNIKEQRLENKKSKDENIKDTLIERMLDVDDNRNNRSQKRENKGSLDDDTTYDLKTLLSQRQDRVMNALHERYQYNTSIKRGQDFLFDYVDSKLCLVVMYADLVGSTKMSMTLPVEKMVKVIKAFSYEISSVVDSYDGFVLKYVGDAIIAFFSSGFNKYLACDTAVRCAYSMINVIENSINPILENDNLPKLALKIGIDEGENIAILYGFDKSSPIDLIGYPMNVAAKMTSLTGPNKISAGNKVYRLLHPTVQSDFHEMLFKEDEWKYIDIENNLPYKVYTT